MRARLETAEARRWAAHMLEEAGVVLAPREEATIVVTDLGLGEFARQGVAIFTYVNTDRYGAKELVFLPRQTVPQHRCPPVGAERGKQETFRCRSGQFYLYVEGELTPVPHCAAPEGSEAFYTVWHEVALGPGDQYTVEPNTWHWFQAGPSGAVVTEFSSRTMDEHDIFADSRIGKLPAASKPR